MPPAILFWIVLLPIAPALLLFWVLPQASEGAFGGKLFGVTVKFGGPAALWAAAFWILLHTSSVWNPPNPSQVWIVSGQVVDQEGNPIQDLTPADVALFPANPDIQPSGGMFTVKFVTERGENGGVLYPNLYLSHHDLDGKQGVVYIPPPPLDLDPQQLKQQGMEVNEQTHEIKLTVIKLSRAGSYANAVAGQPPPPAAQEHPSPP